jgi:very-short-patch-repair endonuclease
VALPLSHAWERGRGEGVWIGVNMKERARAFRKDMTDAENRIGYFLRDRRLNGHKFIREQSIGNYIADFVCRSKKIVIEIDGGQHVDNIEYDAWRTNFLQSRGYKVLRIWNDEVLTNIEGVLEAILAVLEEA